MAVPMTLSAAAAMTKPPWMRERSSSKDLETLNQQLASRLNGRNTQFLFTGDLFSGKNHCGMGDLVDCLYECWRSDPVHGDKSAYLKLAMGLLDFLEPKLDPNDPRLPGRKRRR
jgi:hypothetical protein